MAGTLCIGYDVEDGTKITTGLFLDQMVKLHESLQVPCTLFIKGQTLEQNWVRFKWLRSSPLFDLQQHTYSHLIFKRIECHLPSGKVEVYGEDEPIRKIKKDVEKANVAFKKILAFKPIGLSAPYAFYQGFSGRPDILGALHDAGIRFVRSDGRNEQEYNPVPLDVQPHFYDAEGFPDMLECPANGWQDCLWREEHGWTARWDEQVCSDLDYISGEGRDLYMALVQHDWSSINNDPTMDMTRAIIEHAIERSIRIMHYRNFYAEYLAQNAAKSA
jgi:peptidoglycan/xylan/chitin deacetylase (PgdA/CDA1 family)